MGCLDIPYLTSMKKVQYILVALIFLLACRPSTQENENGQGSMAEPRDLAQEVVDETRRSWNAYKEYAWGHDALAPLTKTYRDWYEKPLYISPIDAYSTLFMMGMKDECAEIEQYVTDSLDFDVDIDAKVFEVNIRILGGLLSMYELSRNEGVLAKAKDFADRMLPAFDTKTGIPTYWVNLKTGVPKGDTVNVAEAATYTFEMGVLSYYTKDPKYYQAGKKATMAIYDRRSKLDLIGDVIHVQTGKWISTKSHICAGVDSYYEYMYKSLLMFGDEELEEVWNTSIAAIQKYLADEHEGRLFYARAEMETGEKVSSVMTLYDAFFPGTLVLSGDIPRAKRYQQTWDWLWQKYGLEPMVYDYKKDTSNYPVYDLNPEIIESACYLFKYTGDSSYYRMNEKYWDDIKAHCRTEVAYTSLANVLTKEQKDYMPTFFFAETLKYLWWTFADQDEFPFKDYLCNTEAHPFKRSHFEKEKAIEYLGLDR